MGNQRIVFVLFMLILTIWISCIKAQSDEINNYMHNCMKGNNPDLPVYISLLPFMDVDTNSCAFMTEHASIIYEEIKQFYLGLQSVIEVKTNEAGHTVPATDRNLTEIIDCILKPGISKNKIFSDLEKTYFEPYHSDIIILGKYRNTQEALELILYFVVKSQKKIITRNMTFPKIEFFCEKMIPNSKSSKTVLCKNKKNFSLYIFLKIFMENLCPGFLDKLTADSDNSGIKKMEPSSEEQPNTNQSSIVYISHLSFMNSSLGYSLNSTSSGDLIDAAVTEGIKKAIQSNKSITLNSKGHHYENTNTNCNTLVNIFFDPNLDQDKKIKQITSTLLIPNQIDYIITGQLITQNNPPKMNIMLLGKNKPVVNKAVPIFKAIFCFDPNNPSQKQLCPGVPAKIADTVYEILINNLQP